EDIDVAAVLGKAIFGEALSNRWIPILGILLAHDLDLARVDQRLQEFILAGFILLGAIFALVALDAGDLYRGFRHSLDQFGSALALLAANSKRVKHHVSLGLSADGIVIVENDRHIRLGRSRQFAGREIGVGGSEEDYLRPLGNGVLDLRLLLGRVTLGVRDNAFDVRGFLLHRRNETRRIT